MDSWVGEVSRSDAEALIQNGHGVWPFKGIRSTGWLSPGCRSVLAQMVRGLSCPFTSIVPEGRICRYRNAESIGVLQVQPLLPRRCDDLCLLS